MEKTVCNPWTNLDSMNRVALFWRLLARRKTVLLLVGILLGLVSLVNLFETLSYIPRLDRSNILTDFHSYWYFGQFVRQGVNPYLAWLDGTALEFPIEYVDGSFSTREEIEKRANDLATTPANTAPIVLFFSLFSLFPWTWAGALWILVNTLIAFTIPFLLSIPSPIMA